MKWFGHGPAFGTALLLVLPAIAAETFLAQRTRWQLQQARAALASKIRERDRLTRLSPAPSPKNERAIASALGAMAERMDSLGAGSFPAASPLAAEPVPGSTVEAFFAIAVFVERMREAALQAHVRIGPEERFGFASYAESGPETELIPAVSRQQVLAQVLIEALIAARPQALFALQRERPHASPGRLMRRQSGSDRTARADRPSAGNRAGDYFELPSELLLRSAGGWDGDAMRLEFAGQTRVLRDFLNTLASSARPLAVRSVEVEALDDPAVAVIHSAPPAGGVPLPLVSPHNSRFVVVIESIRPVAEAKVP